MRRHLALIGLLPGVVACGGGANPTAPALPEATLASTAAVLTFLSGETQMPVASAVVQVDGRRYMTDPEGRVTIESALHPYTPLDVEAPAFFLRRAHARTDRFTLWPTWSPTGLDEEYTARLVYNCAGGDSAGDPLMRVVTGPVFVTPASDLLADDAARSSHMDAVDLISAATRGAVTFSVTAAAPAGGIAVSTWVNPRDAAIVSMGAAAVTRRSLGHHGEVVEASIVFRSLTLARRLPLVLHELGHVFGLGHSPRSGDVMWNGPELYETTDFSPRERLAIDLMLQRLPGNRFPDSEETVVYTAAARAETLAVCPLPRYR